MVTELEVPESITESNGTPKALSRFSFTEKHIAEATARYKALIALPKIPEDDLRSQLTAFVRARNAIDDERKKQGEDARKLIAAINAEAKEVTARLAPMEMDLQTRWDAIQDEKARVKREKEEAHQRAIQEKIDAENAARKAEQEAEAARLKELEAKLAERQAELDRQEAERKAKAEAEAKIEREREEAARKERERIEAAEREKQRQADEAARKVEQERLAKIAAEQEAERKRLAEEAAALKAEQDRLARIEYERKAREQAEKEAAEKAERDRLEAIAKAEREAAAAARMEALKPDKAKLATWAKEIRAIAKPTVKSAEAKAAVEAALTGLNEVAAELEKFAA